MTYEFLSKMFEFVKIIVLSIEIIQLVNNSSEVILSKSFLNPKFRVRLQKFCELYLLHIVYHGEKKSDKTV